MKMKTTVAGVVLRRGLKPFIWYASMGPNNVPIEFRPTLGKRSGVPNTWRAYKSNDRWSSARKEALVTTVRLKACVEKVTALYWGEPT